MAKSLKRVIHDRRKVFRGAGFDLEDKILLAIESFKVFGFGEVSIKFREGTTVAGFPQVVHLSEGAIWSSSYRIGGVDYLNNVVTNY